MISLLLSLLLGTGTAHAAVPSLTVHASFPAIGTIAKGAQRIPMMTLKLQASCAAPVTLDTMTLHHQGMGATTDISGVYVSQKMRRITRSATFTAREKSAILRFRGFTIAPCATETLTVHADISPNAASTGNHVIALETAADIDANDAKVTVGSGTASKPAQTGAVSKGTVTVTYLPVPRRVDFGTNRIVSKLKLTADSESRQAVDAITFTNEGKAEDEDLQNLWIANTRGERVSEFTAQMDEERVRIHFTKPLMIERNGNVILELHADVRSSRTRTIQFVIEEPSDVEARAVSGRVRE